MRQQRDMIVNMKNKARIQSLISLALAVLIWILSFGMVFSLISIVFGLGGIYFANKKDKASIIISLLGLILALLARVADVLFIHEERVNGTLIFVVTVLILSSLLLYKKLR